MRNKSLHSGTSQLRCVHLQRGDESMEELSLSLHLSAPLSLYLSLSYLFFKLSVNEHFNITNDFHDFEGFLFFPGLFQVCKNHFTSSKLFQVFHEPCKVPRVDSLRGGDSSSRSPRGRASRRRPRRRTSRRRRCRARPSPRRWATGSSSSDLEETFRARREGEEPHSC